MLIFHAYHRQQGEPRSKIIIPDTAHGTNPASARSAATGRCR
jgi:glycine dehydrogenase subunit 2